MQFIETALVGAGVSMTSSTAVQLKTHRVAHPTSSVAIVGPGLVEVTTAYALLLSGVAPEIVLIGRDRARVEGNVHDLMTPSRRVGPCQQRPPSRQKRAIVWRRVSAGMLNNGQLRGHSQGPAAWLSLLRRRLPTALRPEVAAMSGPRADRTRQPPSISLMSIRVRRLRSGQRVPRSRYALPQAAYDVPHPLDASRRAWREAAASRSR